MPATEEQSRSATTRPRRTSGLRVSATSSIASALVLKDHDLFFLCPPHGSIPLGGDHGFGLYYHDCRFLNGYQFAMADSRLDTLVATAARGFTALVELTNPDIDRSEQLIEKEQLGVLWERTVDGESLVLEDRFELRNYGVHRAEIPVSLDFSAGFESIFTIRGLAAGRRGTLRQPEWRDGKLHFRYDGADGVRRTLTVAFSQKPRSIQGTKSDFSFPVDSGGCQELKVTIGITESTNGADARRAGGDGPDARTARADKERKADESLAAQTTVRTDSATLRNVLDRSLRDLQMLKSWLEGEPYFAAGVPWYVALFGRDSLVASYQMLAFDPDIAAHTLRLLAKYQGQKEDAWRDEEPGKIMHELRVGERAHLNEIPQTPYYGSVDSTPLFLGLVAHHASWTGSLDLFNELRPNIEAGLEWCTKCGDRNADGFLDYATGSKGGLSNQGWKDSGDAISNADGSLATAPIALVEVQGYLYMAKRGLSDLYARAGDRQRAAQLMNEAAALKKAFNKAFWLDDLQFYALALQKDDRPCEVVASNPGQALWTGIVDEDKAERVVRRLFAKDMFNGWGIRTLSSEAKRYNPIGYHVGTVWPHDNSIIAAGLRTYGFSEEACNVFGSITEAAIHFPHYRLPEVFAGFTRDRFTVPVRYPVACHPQAWAAGSIPFLVQSLLGLSPDAFDRRLRIINPVLPAFVHHLELHGLRVGSARVDLRFARGTGGLVSVDVIKTEGQVQVEVIRK